MSSSVEIKQLDTNVFQTEKNSRNKVSPAICTNSNQWL